MKKGSSQLVAGATCLILASSVLASANQQSIHGNPIGGRDDYTINTSKAGSVTVQCQFTNSGKVPAKIDIWLDPASRKKPADSITVKPGSKSKPTIVKTKYRLSTSDAWWCGINTPDNAKKDWKYCSYFSVSDAMIHDHVPFGSNWSKQTRDKHSAYQCQLKNASTPAQFFTYTRTV
jgi:hypothetical protein